MHRSALFFLGALGLLLCSATPVRAQFQVGASASHSSRGAWSTAFHLNVPLAPMLRSSTVPAPPEALPPQFPPIPAPWLEELTTAVLDTHRLHRFEQDIASMRTRARARAALPEVRLRVTRLIGEGESLSPTEYDPERMTSTGSASLWLEARTTWRLDFALFADEEVPLLRQSAELLELRMKLTAKLAEALTDHHAAFTALNDAVQTQEALSEAATKCSSAVQRLDLLTRGHFSERVLPKLTRWWLSSARTPPAKQTH